MVADARACMHVHVQAALHHPFAAENLAALAIKISRAEYEPLAAAVGLRQAAAGSDAASADIAAPSTANRGSCYTHDLLALPSQLLQTDPALRPPAAALLLNPIVLAHGSTFGESVDRCAASARVLRNASHDPTAFGQAFGVSEVWQGSGAVAGAPGSVDYADGSGGEGAGSSSEGGAPAGAPWAARPAGSSSSSGGATGMSADDLARWEAKLAMLLCEEQLAVMHAQMHDAIMCTRDEAAREAERVRAGHVAEVEMLRAELRQYEASEQPIALGAASSTLNGGRVPAGAAAGSGDGGAAEGSKTRDGGWAHDPISNLLLDEVAAPRLPPPPSRLTPSPSESLGSDKGERSAVAPSQFTTAPTAVGGGGPSHLHDPPPNIEPLTSDAEISRFPFDGPPAASSIDVEIDVVVGGGGGRRPFHRPAEPAARAALGELQPLELLRTLREREEMLQAKEIQVRPSLHISPYLPRSPRPFPRPFPRPSPPACLPCHLSTGFPAMIPPPSPTLVTFSHPLHPLPPSSPSPTLFHPPLSLTSPIPPSSPRLPRSRR